MPLGQLPLFGPQNFQTGSSHESTAYNEAQLQQAIHTFVPILKDVSCLCIGMSDTHEAFPTTFIYIGTLLCMPCTLSRTLYGSAWLFFPLHSYFLLCMPTKCCIFDLAMQSGRLCTQCSGPPVLAALGAFTLSVPLPGGEAGGVALHAPGKLQRTWSDAAVRRSGQHKLQTVSRQVMAAPLGFAAARHAFPALGPAAHAGLGGAGASGFGGSGAGPVAEGRLEDSPHAPHSDSKPEISEASGASLHCSARAGGASPALLGAGAAMPLAGCVQRVAAHADASVGTMDGGAGRAGSGAAGGGAAMDRVVLGCGRASEHDSARLTRALVAGARQVRASLKELRAGDPIRLPASTLAASAPARPSAPSSTSSTGYGVGGQGDGVPVPTPARNPAPVFSNGVLAPTPAFPSASVSWAGVPEDQPSNLTQVTVTNSSAGFGAGGRGAGVGSRARGVPGVVNGTEAGGLPYGVSEHGEGEEARAAAGAVARAVGGAGVGIAPRQLGWEIVESASALLDAPLSAQFQVWGLGGPKLTGCAVLACALMAAVLCCAVAGGCTVLR